MADNLADCLARAANARALAEAEPLENARNRHLASAKVWEDMAMKVQETADKRAAREDAALAVAQEASQA